MNLTGQIDPQAHAGLSVFPFVKIVPLKFASEIVFSLCGFSFIGHLD
jgi:hypothetical protein